MLKYDMRMSYNSIPKMVIITNIIVIGISLINFLLDSNYMFLRVQPNSVSPFLMGEWPVYIIMVQLFSILLLALFIKIQDYFLNRVHSK